MSVEVAENANVRKYEINQPINHQDDFRNCIKKLRCSYYAPSLFVNVAHTHLTLAAHRTANTPENRHLSSHYRKENNKFSKFESHIGSTVQNPDNGRNSHDMNPAQVSRRI